jgi:basic membrane protein A
VDSHQHADLDWQAFLPGFLIFPVHNRVFLPVTHFAKERIDMTDLQKLSLKIVALTTVAAAALVGCGKKEETAPTPAPAPVATAPAPAPKPEPLKIAFAYVGPVGDGGWTFAHDNGRKALEKEFGDKIKTSYVESVPEGADAERVLRDMAGQGNKLIFGTTFGYMEPMLKVAADNKDVKFEHATGYKQAENMRTYDSRTYEGAYMAGVIAGKMTKTNTLGVVASVPIPEVIRNINSFTLGAQSSNPKIKTKVVWVNGWFDPPKETEAATSLINGGADVLFQNTDSPAVLKTAEAKGKRAFGWDSDMTAYGPKAHLASSVINWGPYYIKATKDALEGKWVGGGHSWWGVKEGAIDIVSIAEDVPAETKAKVEEVKKGLADGSFAIWKGPITDNTGKVQVAKDTVADDKFLGGLNFFVKGVEGEVPGSK